MKRVTFIQDNTVQVFRLGKTTNAKISKGNENIVQTYTFSVDQFDYIREVLESNSKPTLKGFFSLDAKNCFDCPFSVSGGNGGCYTHKYMQYSGLVSMLKSLIREFKTVENIPTYDSTIEAQLIKMSIDKYVRFGTYGEPSMHPIEVVKQITKVAFSWTGYTHQYFRKPEYAAFFMASVHNQAQAMTADAKFGYRSFLVTKHDDVENIVHCPASKEMGFKSNCADCGLCSGTSGKGKKSVLILEH
jgi:hypothetical protein